MSELEGSHRPGTVGQVKQLSQTGRQKFKKWEKEFRDFLKEAQQAEDQSQFPAEALSELDRIRGLVKDHEGTLRQVRVEIENAAESRSNQSRVEDP
ncbi:MAG: hypothetical protein V2A61_00785 [Calditrichota bacterium]